jgi:short subunit dehydrogenase-like uncharacterized protein
MSDESDLMWVRHDGDLDVWVGPFVMAGVNTRVVRRSNALQGWAYGRRFRYREITHFGSGAAAAVKASAAGIGLLSFRAGLSYRPTRVLLDRVLPAPGAGPNEKARQAGSVLMELHTHTSGGAHYSVLVAAQGDPGHTVSSLIIGEAVLGLALDLDRLPRAGGVLTPATALGTLLVARLRAAGVTMTTRRNEPDAPGRLSSQMLPAADELWLSGRRPPTAAGNRCVGEGRMDAGPKPRPSRDVPEPLSPATDGMHSRLHGAAE